MYIRSLQNTGLTTIVNTILEAFEGYFVQLPTSTEYWQKRFTGARVNLNLSFGVFDGNELIALVIHGIDTYENKLTAFNLCTGVIPGYRGMHLVDKIYQVAVPKLKENGIATCRLEVIRENQRAIKAYERIGYSVDKDLMCFSGSLNATNAGLQIESVDFDSITEINACYQNNYSWEYRNEAIARNRDSYKYYLVSDAHKNLVGYFIINPLNGHVQQVENVNGSFEEVVNTLGAKYNEVKLNNVCASRRDISSQLLQCGLKNTINQFEMQMPI